VKIDSARLQPYAPILALLVIVALGWALLVRPTMTKNARAASDLEGLRQRLATARTHTGGAPMTQPVGDPVEAFERQVTVSDAGGRVMEELSRLASQSRVQVDTIESAQEETAAFGGGPSVAGGSRPDPRLALFGAPLMFSPVTLTAESDYRGLGEFLWLLRDLGALIEIRNLEINVPGAEGAGATDPPGLLRVTLTLFVYARTAGATGEAAE
jgi:hypothetical protein